MGSTLVTTPFLDRHNDYIQIYVRAEKGGFLLTNDAHAITDLEMSGLTLDPPTRRKMLRTALNRFGVHLEDRAIQVHATADNFGLRKHNLIQAILAMNDLFFPPRKITSHEFPALSKL